MSDHIPIEIITNILERITGVKDLVRWRRVSKEWLALIDSDDFIQRHLQRSSESSSSSTSKLGLFVRSISRCAFYQPPGNIRRFSHETGGELLGSCNGLICFRIYSDSRPQILNPATGERRFLDTCNLFPVALSKGYGFGYDQSSDDYKLVRFLDGNAEIHSVRARYRRVVKFPLIQGLHQAKGVFACGALHWIDDRMDSTPVYAFDLGSETVSKLSLPADFDAGYFVSPEVGVVDLCLCVYRLLMGSRFDLWMMKEYGNKDSSWVRIYQIDLSFIKVTDYPVSMVGFPRGRILFLLNRSELVWFDPVRNRVEEAMQVTDMVDDHCARLDAFYWFDSLVKIYPHRRMKEEEVEDANSIVRTPHINRLILQLRSTGLY